MTPAQTTDFVSQLQSESAAVRLAGEKLGVRRTLDKDQVQLAAQQFGADADRLTAAKKLLNTRHPAYRKVLGIRAKARALWIGMTIPYPETGVRLIRRSSVAIFDSEMTQLRTDLAFAATQLQAVYMELRAEAEVRLGDLFNHDDYPARVDNAFSIEWDYPTTEPPEYLKKISPALYAQQQARITARFTEAIQLAEEAFTAELSKLVNRLVDRLKGESDCKPKVFRDTTVENLHDFFERFSKLNTGASNALAEVVQTAQEAVGGVQPSALRKSDGLRESIAKQLTDVQGVIDGMMVDKPKRAISLDDDE